MDLPLDVALTYPEGGVSKREQIEYLLVETDYHSTIDQVAPWPAWLAVLSNPEVLRKV